MKIHTLEYIDWSDLSPESQEVIKEAIPEIGISNGEYYGWTIKKENIEDSVEYSYLGDKVNIVSDEIREKLNTKDIDYININIDW